VEDRAARLEHERDQQAELAATAERTRIARELHDIVAHSLSVMVALADGAALTTATDASRAVDAMEQVSATGREALTDMRALLGVLRTDDSDQDLAPQPGLEELADLLGRTRGAGVPVSLTVSGPPSELPRTAQSTVYRVVQEALTNTLKHGREVGEVRVRLLWSTDALDLEVSNDGLPVTPGTGGHGLVGMTERVALHGGTVSTGPRRSGGWTVSAHLPLGAPA
jgi:signal transduction histidine kinase